jgi:hypothetical protein
MSSLGELVPLTRSTPAASTSSSCRCNRRYSFLDLAWQHQAYREGGIKALAAANARGELDQDA